MIDARTGARRRLPPAGVRGSEGDLNGLTYAWRPAHGTIVYAYDQNNSSGSVTAAAVREASPGAGTVRLVTTIPCAWDACSAIKPHIDAVSGDGGLAIVSTLSERFEPVAREAATANLVDLEDGALKKLPPLGLAWLAPETR